MPGNKAEEVGVVQGTVVGKDKFGEGGEVDKIPLLSAIVLVFLCPLFCLFFSSWLNSIVFFIVQALLVLWQLNWNGEGSLFIESSVYKFGQ